MAIIANVRPGRWAAGLCVLTALLFPGAARAEGTDTTQKTTLQGTDSDQTAARWDLWGALTYSATPTGYLTTVYSWGTDAAVIYLDPSPYVGTMFAYADAPVYYRAFIYYNPGGAVVWWESCKETQLEVVTLAPTVRNVRRFSPVPGTQEGSMATDVRYKVQSSRTNSLSDGLGVEVTLSKSK